MTARPTPPITAPSRRAPFRHRTLRRRVAKLLRTIGASPIDDAQTVVAALATHLGTEIQIVETPLPVDGSGWFGETMEYRPASGPSKYVIFVQQATTPAHQAHIIFHEMAHIVLGTTKPLAGQLAEALTHRTGNYRDPDECDAEFIARCITTWTHAADDSQLVAQSDEGAAKLVQMLQDRIAWS